MALAEHCIALSILLRDGLRGASEQAKRVVRFLVWRWRGAHLHSTIRSLDVALRARIGSRVIIERGVFIDPHSQVGDYSYINPNSSVESAVIGKFCSIARDVMIGPATHNYRNVSSHPFWYQSFYGFSPAPATVEHGFGGTTLVGDDVWIGCGAVIMQGVTVGTGAVIGAGSIVTRSVDPYEIWAGVPAKKIGQRFSDPLIAALVDSGWTALDPADIARYVIPHIGDAAAMLEALAPLKSQRVSPASVSESRITNHEQT